MFFGELMDVRLVVREKNKEDEKTRLYQDAMLLANEGLGEFEECVRVLKVNQMNYEAARNQLYKRIYVYQ